MLMAVLVFFRIRLQQPWAQSVSYDCANLMGLALLMLLYRGRKDQKRPALYRFVSWIGLYSYGIYLWHVSVIAPIVSFAPRLPRGIAIVWEGAGPFVLGSVLGIMFTRLVEFPSLKLRDKVFPPRVDSAVGISARVEAKDPDLNRGSRLSADPLSHAALP
jgi:peptidoglycan/LPS O-acetylase OafA/YrhL